VIISYGAVVLALGYWTEIIKTTITRIIPPISWCNFSWSQGINKSILDKQENYSCFQDFVLKHWEIQDLLT
jgi:hypothetical protein